MRVVLQQTHTPNFRHVRICKMEGSMGRIELLHHYYIKEVHCIAAEQEKIDKVLDLYQFYYIPHLWLSLIKTPHKRTPREEVHSVMPLWL